jgi:branched-chain amino acid transport system ATP-binding protein
VIAPGGGPGEVLLEGSGLTKRYGGVVALDDVSITLRAGEVLGLVGPNGAGKTTLVDLISGAQTATSGQLRLLERPLAGSASKRAKAGLARTFQHPLLALDLSVRDNLLVGLAARRHRNVGAMLGGLVKGMVRGSSAADHGELEELATELNLGDLSRQARDLTLGEQRLAEVARALAQDPRVMLLDEPFAGSDAAGVDGIIEALRTVQGRGHGVILVDHNVDLVASVVDRIMLLDQGQVRFDGDPVACLASREMQTVYFGAREEDDDVA